MKKYILVCIFISCPAMRYPNEPALARRLASLPGMPDYFAIAIAKRVSNPYLDTDDITDDVHALVRAKDY